ncbi:hypothetical protein SAMN05421841_2697 [Chryseobacterium wanjuense]|jgi:hypothetical protein|uniref:Uncharacterized protein n=1 Tax=Chryseobacterium wanjuense TaxID=356305 RepID=A0A1I0RHI3_9FLAO|nr:hypothetical protein [Chryseobacterium wanjuense]SEW40348.1 hypothetical protein SAMN05421841_2697 [Chryseobacterium wanjuense]
MRKLFVLAMVSFSVQIFAQVGVNTTAPSASFDITAKEPTGTSTTVDGVLVPRVDRQRAQSMTSVPTSTMIYVNNIATGSATGTTANVDTIGFYYFDGTVWVKMATGNGVNIYNADGSLAGVRNVNLNGNNLGFTGTGNVGVGIATPTAKLEIASGTNGTSGLKFSNINNSTAATANASALGIDAAGNVVVQSAAPIQTRFVSYPVNATVTESPTLQIGTLEFKVIPGQCSSPGTGPYTTIQARSITGANNIGIVHGQYGTSQATGQGGFQLNYPITVGTSFSTVPATYIDCYNDGHSQFMYFSYTDQTYYRINYHIADGDSLGFGGQGYIFVEYQK